MKTIRRKNLGLTLLELMVVIAIVSILATIAIPSYQHYSHKAKFSEVIQAVAPYKLAVTTCAHEHEGLSDCATPGQKGIPANFAAPDNKTGYTASVTVGAGGVITATSQRIKIDKEESFTYILTPKYQGNGQITWVTSGTCSQQGLC